MPEIISNENLMNSKSLNRLQDEHDSFVITEGEKDHDPGALSHQLQVTDLVEKILEGKIDLESCADCNHLLMAELNKRIKQVEQDTQHYRTALDAFGKDVQDDEDPKVVEAELDKLLEEEKALRSKLHFAEEESKATQREITKVKAEVEELRKNEQELEREYAKLKTEMYCVDEERLSHELEYRAMTLHLQKLKSINPLAAAFHICKKDNFGVINGLRLGWTEKENVPWPELSAAWGQTALLTQCLAKKLNIENFENFKLVPLGEKSFLEDKSGNRLPLYTSQNVRTKFFGDRQFDAAMVAYMEIMCEIRDALEKQSIVMPYKIDRGQIQDTNGSNEWFTVKFSFSSGDQWCDAMRLLLCNLKWAREGIYTSVEK